MNFWPDVAVIMPVLNEENYLDSAVSSILAQNYPGKLRLILSIGPSTDKTWQIAENLSKQNSNIVILKSPTGRTPDSLNIAIKECSEEIIVRVDAHAELSEKYIEIAVETINRTGADNVGGIMGAIGKTNFEKAVAAAMTSPLGVGAASFHTGGVEGPAETVYLGVFNKSALVRVGGYDTKFTRAQDWEMNHRIRSTGGLVWFNPKLFVTYRPRPNVSKLAKQYFQYGNWRREVMRHHPQTTKRISAIRYFIPPITVVGMILGTILGFVGISQSSNLIYGFLAPATYILMTITSSFLLRKKAGTGSLWLPVALATMQISWGLGFIFGTQTLRKDI